MKVSVLIPLYNEKACFRELIRRVCLRPEPNEIIVVDDGSNDGSGPLLDQLKTMDNRIAVFHHKHNMGKGAAIRTGLKQVSGEIVIIQDADLEYNPADYPVLLAPFQRPQVDVVYGSRMLNPGNKFSYFSFKAASVLFSLIISLLFHAKITDEPTGYKVFRRDTMRGLRLEANGFDFCVEVSVKLLRKGIHILEVPVSYVSRTRAEGKKIRFYDGIIITAAFFKHYLNYKRLNNIKTTLAS